MTLPPLYFTTAQARQVAEQAATINPYVKQAFAQFVTGAMDVERDWKRYVDALEGMELPKYLAAYQEGYAAKTKR
jgi:putative aldouronate transport system substrate-binding protein